MFDCLHYSQIFNTIIAVNAVDVINLLALPQRFDKCVSHKAMNKFLLPTSVSMPTVTQIHVNVRALATVVRPNAQLHHALKHRHRAVTFAFSYPW